MKKEDGIKYWSLPVDILLSYFNSSLDGLKSEDAAIRLKEQGANSIKKQKNTSQLVAFAKQFNNPIVIILIIATGISAASGDWIDAGIIFLIVLASALLSFLQEYSASNALEELREKVQVKSIVIRDGKSMEISSKDLVIGDIISISVGSLVPADGLIIESLDFSVNQSILTGETLPTEKKPAIVLEDVGVKDRINCVFMGTNVQNGSAKVLIVATGENTEFGKIADKLTLRPPETEFERGIRHFGYFLTQIMLILTLVVFAINIIFKKPAIDSLLFSVALAVGITPQLLPAIISITLSKGSRTMAKEGVIVRRLNAIENFGSMDILCTDKTGTLTEGTIRIDGAVDVRGQSSEDVFRLAYLNASLQTGMTNSLDDAISEIKGIDIKNIVKLGEIPFDFTRARLSVIVEDNNKPTMIVKGALNNILNICSHIRLGNELKVKDDILLNDIQQLYATWSSQGTRILGVAQKTVPLKEKYLVEDEKDMVFVGFILLSDHPKADVSETILDLENSGVSLRIITGDNKLIAMHTAEAVGLKVTAVLTGDEVSRLSDESLWHKVETTNIFAEVDPNQKERIILALKKKSHVVGYMGDGINDVPALHAADVSISVNNAADVAKESADLVLLENSLKVLNRGIQLGRTTFSNTLKYIQVTTSANFGNMFSMAFASLFLPFLPLLPKQILLINFLTDFPALTISNDSVDPELLKDPRSWDIKLIRNFMIIFGLISSVFDFIAFAVLLIIFKSSEVVFQGSWFTISIVTELLILMVMRTQRPFFRSKPAPMLLYSSLLVCIFTLALPFLPFHNLLSIYPIKAPVLISMFVIASLYIIVTEIAKYYFYRVKAHK